MQRNTVQRTLILETVRAMHTHPTADEIYAAVAQRRPGISRATVYRVLGNLSEEGEITRVAMANAPDRFDFTLGDHAHILCERCRKVFDLPVSCIPTVTEDGFVVKRMRVTASGLCPACAAEVCTETAVPSPIPGTDAKD